MKKGNSIVLTTVAIIAFGVFTYYGSLTVDNKETDSIVIDKHGEVVEPLSGNNDNMGH